MECGTAGREQLAMEHRLQSYSDYFTSIFSLIPAHYRTESNSEETRPGNETRFWHLKKLADRPTHKMTRKNTTSLEKAKEETAQRQEIPRTGVNVNDKKSLSLSELRRRLREKMNESGGIKRVAKESGKKRTRGSSKRKQDVDKKQQRIEEKKRRKDAIKKDKQRKVAVKVASNDQDSPQFTFSLVEFNEYRDKGVKKKNYTTLIAKAEARKNKMEELMKEDEEKGEAAQEKEKWSKAISMARGEKVKDDPVLLKKTVKKLEKKKESHVKKWRERMEAEQQRQVARQKKRKENIRERVKMIKAKKLRKNAKKHGLT